VVGGTVLPWSGLTAAISSAGVNWWWMSDAIFWAISAVSA